MKRKLISSNTFHPSESLHPSRLTLLRAKLTQLMSFLVQHVTTYRYRIKCSTDLNGYQYNTNLAYQKLDRDVSYTLYTILYSDSVIFPDVDAGCTKFGVHLLS